MQIQYKQQTIETLINWLNLYQHLHYKVDFNDHRSQIWSERYRQLLFREVVQHSAN